MASPQSEKPQGLRHPVTKGILPNPYAAAAEGAPVRYTEEQAKAAALKKNAFHNPHAIKRPQPKNAQIVRKPTMPPVVASSSSEAGPVTAGESRETPAYKQPSYEYFLSTEQDDAEYMDYMRQQQKEEKERKKQYNKFRTKYGPWQPSSPYQPATCTNSRAYEVTGEYRHILSDFHKYVQRMASRQSRSRRNSSESATDIHPAMKPQDHASSETPCAPSTRYDAEDSPHSAALPATTPIKPPNESSPPTPYVAAHPPPPPPPPEAPVAAAPPPSTTPAAYNPTISAPPVRYSHVIEGAPVRYSQPTIATDRNETAEQERPAKRQKLSKAEAMMAKMGYEKGKGLGKNSDGVTTALAVKPRKQKTTNREQVSMFDDPDDQSMHVKSQQVWDITGGKLTKPKEPERFGEASKVIVAWGCIDGVDWNLDADRNDGGIRQEMGQIFDEKFGRIEQIVVNQTQDAQAVYIKFCSELSALNAVNRFAEGYQFRGRDIRAQYYSEAKFDQMVFDN